MRDPRSFEFLTRSHGSGGSAATPPTPSTAGTTPTSTRDFATAGWRSPILWLRWIWSAPRLAREWEAHARKEAEAHRVFLMEMAGRKDDQGKLAPDSRDILQIAREQHKQIIANTAHLCPPVRTPYDRPPKT